LEKKTSEDERVSHILAFYLLIVERKKERNKERKNNPLPN